MQSSISVLEEAPDISLVSVYEAKVSLRITSDVEDELLEFILRNVSSQVATYCNRVFVKERVVETLREIPSDITCLYLNRYPVKAKDIVSVVENGQALSIDDDYELDSKSGRLLRLGGIWGEPVVVTYSGGYDVPQEVPPALRQAVMLFTRESYFTALRGDSSIRMVAHKENRVIYFDPNIANRSSSLSSSGGTASNLGGTATQRAVRDLLTHFTRYEV